MFYVIEIQTDSVGSVLPYAFANLPDAEEKYHDVLRVASKSNCRKHGCMIVNEDMFIIKSEVYEHEVTE